MQRTNLRPETQSHPSRSFRAAALVAFLLAVGLAGCGGGYSPPPTAPTPPTISTQALLDGTVGVAYSATLTATGGSSPYTWSLASGTLPPGLSLNSTTGAFTGTPTTPGTYVFTLKVTDAASQSATLSFTVVIGTATPLVELISVDSNEVPGNSDSGSPAVSGDGRFVAFTSFATNLVPNDTNNVADVFVRDRGCGDTVRVSVSSSGVQGGSQSFAPAISALVGSNVFVAYASDANNLVANDTNSVRDIFVTALDASACPPVVVSTVRASVATGGTEANLFSNLPSISASGLFVAYHSLATNLVDADLNNQVDVFVTELQFVGGVLSVVRTRRVSTFKAGLAVLPNTTADIFSATTIGNSTLAMTANEHVGRQAQIVSGTGSGQTRTITANDATTLTVTPAWSTTPDATSVFRILSFDDQTATVFSANTIGTSTLTLTANEHNGRVVEIISGTGQGQARGITANDATTFTVSPDWTTPPDGTSVYRVEQQGNNFSSRAKISGNAAFVAFTSPSNFEAADTNGLSDVFVHELATGLTTRVSVDPAGALAAGDSPVSAISGAGGFVLFQSTAANLVAGDTNNALDLFVRDRLTPDTTRASLANDGSQANGSSDLNAALSGGGRLVAFSSFATNLVADDRNLTRDVFLRDRSLPATTRLSLGMGGINANNESFDPAIALNGSVVAFASSATNLVANDTNNATDIFAVTTAIIDPPLVINPKLPAAQQGLPYGASLQAIGGTPPLFWTVSEGALPPGLFLDPRSGLISGIPQKAGRFSFTVLLTDGDRPARRSSQRLALVVGR